MLVLAVKFSDSERRQNRPCHLVAYCIYELFKKT